MNAVTIQKIAKRPAETRALYPIITNNGNIISNAITGNNKKPGTPKPSIQLILPSIFNTLSYAEIMNKAEIRILPTKSKTLDITKS